jgi:hypothetical protein
VNSFVRVKLCSTVEAALVSESDSRRTVVPDLGNGKNFEKEMSDSKVALVFEPIKAGLKQFCRELGTSANKQEVKVVRCIGDRKMLGPLSGPIRSEFPNADFAQWDPNWMIVWGGTLNANASV